MSLKSFDGVGSVRTIRKARSWNAGAAALALAVAAAAPVVLISGPARAMTEMDQALALLADQAAPTDPELLAKGTAQYDKADYESAQTTLQQVKVEGLAAADQQKLRDVLGKVEGALTERQAARAEFEKGQSALGQKDYNEALKHYKAASDNKFADEATRTKAASQMAVAEESLKATPAAPTGPDLKSMYKEAVADYKAGDKDPKRLEDAKAKFTQLQEANYKGGLFDRKPSSFLKEINETLAKQQAPAAPTAVAETPAPQPAAPAAETPATPAAPAAVAEAPQQPAAPPEVTGPSSRDIYEMAVKEYEAGNLDSARAHFTEAQAAGFKTPLFRTSPAKYLSMIDAKQQKAAPEAVAQGQAVTPGAPLTPAEQDLISRQRMDQMRQQQRAYEADQLVKQAEQARKDNRVQDAFSLYARATQLDPSNKAAADGAAQMQLLTTGGGAEGGLMERELVVKTIRTQAIQYSFDKAIADAQAAIGAREFNQAQQALDAARVAKDSAPELFNPQQVAEFNAKIASTQVALSRAAEATEVENRKSAAEKAADDAMHQRELQVIEQRRTILSLVRTAKELVYNGQYERALGVITQILSIDPNNDYAIGVQRLVQDQAILEQQKGLREKAALQWELLQNAAEEQKIPYIDMMVYPTNWPDIAEKRDRQVQAERGNRGADLQVVAALDRQLPAVRLDAVALSDAVDFLRELTGTNIFVNWRMMEAAGVQKSTPVNTQLKDVRFSKVLSTILKDAGGGKLGYAIDDGVITVSTTEDLDKNTSINVLDIRDLLVIAPDFDGPVDFSLDNKGQGSSRGGRSGGGNRNNGSSGNTGSYGNGGSYSGGMLGSGASSSLSMLDNSAKTEDMVEKITSLIKETVDRDSWIDNGGKVGSLKYLAGQLIVTQTAENQRQLTSLLDKLRETRAIQVSIETRFLQVQRNFLEDIGLDLDFFFNITNPTNFSPISVTQSSNVFPATPTTPTPGSIGATAQPGINIQGSFLDDFQVNFLLKATQAALNSTTLTAPRVTVFNGSQAYVVVASQQAYVSDLEAVTGEGVGLFNPIIDTVQSGVRLVVQPTVSADRKYVTLSLQPQVSQLVSLVSFPVFGIANGNTGGTGGGAATPFSANIQLPLIQLTAVNTIVSVPDGGTLLLGGQTLAGEIEVEEGVPILSKIPIIKRLFTNKSTAKDEQVLLILVKPTIIIQREIEQTQFPLLSTRR